jgi:hypothetical protein
MKKIACLLITTAALFLTSCATAGALVKNYITNPDSSLVDLNKEGYTVLGQVSGTGTIIANDKEINQEREALTAGIRPVKDIILEGDTLRYGYLNNTQYPVQTAEEKAVANATYNMIEQALYNDADAVICVKTRMSVIPFVNENGSRNIFNPKSTITAKISGIAIKIKDTGTGIKQGMGEQENLDPAATIKAQKNTEKKAEADAKAAEAKAKADAKAAAKAQEDQSAAAANTGDTQGQTAADQGSVSQ